MAKYDDLAKQFSGDAREIQQLRAEMDSIGDQISAKFEAEDYDTSDLDNAYWKAEARWSEATADLRQEIEWAYSEVPFDAPAQQGIDKAWKLLGIS
jgi:chromosome segregation ATPase